MCAAYFPRSWDLTSLQGAFWEEDICIFPPEVGILEVCRCNQSRFWGECLYLFSPEAGVSEFCLCNQALFVNEYLHYSPEVGISEACRWIMSVIVRAKCGFRKFVVVIRYGLLGECLHVSPETGTSDVYRCNQARSLYIHTVTQIPMWKRAATHDLTSVIMITENSVRQNTSGNGKNCHRSAGHEQ